jgi:cell division cycle protein 20 (cofactor of APC complex)
MLDAPDFMDDYYLNLLSWSSQNVLAVALNQTVYLWEAATGNIAELLTLEGEDDYVSSLSWIQEGGAHLAIGTAAGKSELWDVNEGRRLRSMNGHDARVSSMDWNGHILSTGGRDSQIIHHDVRVRDHLVGSWVGHEQEVCGLKWSPDGTMLATGSNDNTLCLWDWTTKGEGSFGSSRSSLLWKKTDHLAAVKALAWSPHERRVLASGGGTADRTIKIWNCATGAMTSSTDTGSQVCSLLWSPFEKELLSSHGFSDYQLTLWKYPSMTKIKDFTSHTARVLHMALSPDGSSVVSLSADETLRFWDIFAASSSAKQSRRKGRSTVSSDLQNPIKSKGGIMAPSTSAPGMSKKKHHHSHSASGSFTEDGGRLARPIHIR